MTASGHGGQQEPASFFDDEHVGELRRLVAAAFAVPDVVVDEDYRLTAFVAQCPSGGPSGGPDDTMVVELIDRGPRSADRRWQALAYIDGPNRLESTVSTWLVSGETAAVVIRQLADQITASGSRDGLT